MGIMNLVDRVTTKLGVPSPLPPSSSSSHAPPSGPAAASGSRAPAPAPSAPPTYHAANDVALGMATELVASAVADLTAAAAEMHKRGGVVSGAVSLGTTAYNSAAGNEEGPSVKDAGKTLTHDGRAPAKDLVASAEEKYNEALMYITDLPHIEGVVIKAPKGKAFKAAAGGAQIGMLAAGVSVGPIGLIIKKARQKKARKGVDQMLEDMQEVLDHLRHMMSGQYQSQYYEATLYAQQYAPQQYASQQYAAPQQYASAQRYACPQQNPPQQYAAPQRYAYPPQ